MIDFTIALDIVTLLSPSRICYFSTKTKTHFLGIPMFFRQISVIALSALLLLSACGPENGPKFEPQGFTKTFIVSSGKDKWVVEMLIKSFRVSNDKKGSKDLFAQVEPIIVDVLRTEAQSWDMKPPESSDAKRSSDSMRTFHGKNLCEGLKKSLQKNPAIPIISDCLVISLTKI